MDVPKTCGIPSPVGWMKHGGRKMKDISVKSLTCDTREPAHGVECRLLILSQSGSGRTEVRWDWGGFGGSKYQSEEVLGAL